MRANIVDSLQGANYYSVLRITFQLHFTHTYKSWLTSGTAFFGQIKLRSTSIVKWLITKNTPQLL